jgi:DNA-directed RNA polymerase specialized sigma24 family protein
VAADGLLRGTLALHGVDDLEALCAKALDDQLRAMRAHLRPHDHEDALAYLVSEAWLLSERYDPARGWSFSKFCYQTCRRRTIDWYRKRYQYARRDRPPKPELPLSLDDQLEQALAGIGVDPHADRGADLDLRALHRRGRRPAWFDNSSGGPGSRRAA